jgi:ABC-type Mn2+/Zn2+ transport system permease subunit
MSDLWHWLADPWSGEIMRRAFAEVALLGISAGAVGCWVVLNELSYAAESLPHAMFPGLVLAALVGVPLIAGGAAGLLVAVQALGNLLVVALVIAPAAAARLLARRMLPMMAIAAAIAVVGGIAGLYVSYHLRTAAGASIALALVAAYIAAAAAARFNPRRTT